MYLLVLALPFFSTVAAGFFGRYLGGEGAGRLATACIATTFLTSVYIFYEVALMKRTCLITLSP
jgi:NADH:ubiquinone oxidoreductase subunit 5 (subunit L)/multisubunit Na+/H+ antiporter MnhA subunit